MIAEKKLKMLVVEDNPGDYALLAEYLRMSQLPPRETVHADSIGAAASLIRKNDFDIALLDLSLPDSSGIDSVITLDRLLPQTPIVVFSGQTDVAVAREAISLGAQDYLVKGEFDEKLLGKIVHYSIERKRMVEKLRQSNERYEFVNKATLDTIWEWRFGPDSGSWGDGIINTFGYKESDVQYGNEWMKKYIHPEDRDRVNKGLKQSIEASHQHWQDEYRFRCADGSYKDVYDRGFILYDEKGEPARMIGAMTDITEKMILEKKLAEQALKQQKILTEVTIQAQEKERNQLGKELHDNINQVLATIRMFLGMYTESGGKRPDLITKSMSNVSYAMEEIRKLSKSLVAPSLGDIGLTDALEELVEEMNLVGKVQVELVIQLSEEKIDKNMELMLYRIAQEQLNNIRKYASAQKAVITLRTEAGNLFFSIADNGLGFDPAVKARGIGLKNISSRVDFYSGSMDIIAAPGKGCSIEINIPLS
ncbi:MAG TPA: PAS domain-containing protein [Chitinophagaceae bacterium]|jgi:two-component system sensor histidine kinase UhpB|nr:PAS domain-containing protein [Chitinophagaceae bacterium]